MNVLRLGISALLVLAFASLARAGEALLFEEGEGGVFFTESAITKYWLQPALRCNIVGLAWCKDEAFGLSPPHFNITMLKPFPVAATLKDIEFQAITSVKVSPELMEFVNEPCAYDERYCADMEDVSQENPGADFHYEPDPSTLQWTGDGTIQIASAK